MRKPDTQGMTPCVPFLCKGRFSKYKTRWCHAKQSVGSLDMPGFKRLHFAEFEEKLLKFEPGKFGLLSVRQQRIDQSIGVRSTLATALGKFTNKTNVAKFKREQYRIKGGDKPNICVWECPKCC